MNKKRLKKLKTLQYSSLNTRHAHKTTLFYDETKQVTTYVHSLQILQSSQNDKMLDV
jgi:hypothetical protein